VTYLEAKVREGPADAGLHIAIIGMGPRGLSVLERLLARVRTDYPVGPLHIWTIDDHEPGVGRIWRVDQSPWLVMNTVAGQVTMYSGDRDGPVRPGAGPSLVQWAGGQADPEINTLRPDSYTPRYVYGHYLRSVYESLAAHEIPDVVVRPLRGRVAHVREQEERFHLTFADDATAPPMDAVVLATGHSHYTPTEDELPFLDPGLASAYIRGDCAADMPLELVRPGDWVGVLGLGLSFYDVLLSLTEGRGGRFRRDGERLSYLPSGDEPFIIAGSRSGVPFPARGRNQKSPRHEYRPSFLTPEAIAQLRIQVMARTGSDQLDFVRDVWPLLTQDVQLVHDTTLLKRWNGPQTARRFQESFRQAVRAGTDTDEVRAGFGLAGTPALDLRRLADPFRDQEFASPEDFRERLLDALRADLRDAAEGNLDNPIKAALDVLRDVRSIVRGVVDFGGLRPKSHRDDFLGWYHTLNNFLSAGPPMIRVAQTVALIEAGVLHVCGTRTRIRIDPDTRRFAFSSPWVTGSRRLVDVLIDARVPQPALRRDSSPLIRNLLRDGLISEYRNVSEEAGDVFDTGGLAVDRSTFRVIDATGRTVRNLCAVGIPTEHTRWFTHMGSGRPDGPSLFADDADRVATSVLTALGANHARASNSDRFAEVVLP
jgi:uncharacterized NAD(P)/FAD-binding protein YdhS